MYDLEGHFNLVLFFFLSGIIFFGARLNLVLFFFKFGIISSISFGASLKGRKEGRKEGVLNLVLFFFHLVLFFGASFEGRKEGRKQEKKEERKGFFGFSWVFLRKLTFRSYWMLIHSLYFSIGTCAFFLTLLSLYFSVEISAISFVFCSNLHFLSIFFWNVYFLNNNYWENFPSKSLLSLHFSFGNLYFLFTFLSRCLLSPHGKHQISTAFSFLQLQLPIAKLR